MALMIKLVKSEAADRMSEITSNNDLWTGYWSELRGLKIGSNNLDEDSWMNKIQNASIVEHTFLNETPGKKFLELVWEWKRERNTLPRVVATLEKIESQLILRYLKYFICIGCDQDFQNCEALLEHMRGLHWNNIIRSRGREYKELKRERDGCKQFDTIRHLYNNGKLEEFGFIPKWMLFKPPTTGDGDKVKPLNTVPKPPSILPSTNQQIGCFIASKAGGGDSMLGAVYNRRSDVIKDGHAYDSVSQPTRSLLIPTTSLPIPTTSSSIKSYSSKNNLDHDSMRSEGALRATMPITPSPTSGISAAEQPSNVFATPNYIRSRPPSQMSGGVKSVPVPVKMLARKSLVLANNPVVTEGVKTPIIAGNKANFSSPSPGVKVQSPSLVNDKYSQEFSSSSLMRSSPAPSEESPSSRLVNSSRLPGDVILTVDASKISPSHTNFPPRCAGPLVTTIRKAAVAQPSLLHRPVSSIQNIARTPSLKNIVTTVSKTTVAYGTSTIQNSRSLLLPKVTFSAAQSRASVIGTSSICNSSPLLLRKPDSSTQSSPPLKLLLPSKVNSSPSNVQPLVMLKGTGSSLLRKVESLPQNVKSLPVAHIAKQTPSGMGAPNSLPSFVNSGSISSILKKRKAENSSVQNKKAKIMSVEDSNETNLNQESNFNFETGPVNKISKRLNLYGEPDRVEKVHSKFWEFGLDKQKENGGKRLNAVEIMETLLRESDERNKNENQIIWNTMEKKAESPTFDYENEKHYPHFLANWESIHDSVNMANEHGRFCRGELEPTVGGQFSAGLTNKECVYRCRWCNFSYSMRPSPKLGNRGVSDFLSGFAAQTCGGMKSHLVRHYETLQMTLPTNSNFLNGCFKIDLLQEITKKKADEVKEAALQKCVSQNGGTVRLKIDMAHQNRTNSSSSTLTGMDTSTNDILTVHNVHRPDEAVSQKHEPAAAEEMCQFIKRLELLLQVAITDKGSGAQAVIRKHFPDCIIQWDNWHALKSLEKGLKALFGNDAVFKDKIKKIRSHVYWTIKTYKLTVEEYLDDAKREAAMKNVQDLILQLCQHFQGAFSYDRDNEGVLYHSGCHPNSRCQTNPNYVNTKAVLTEDEAKTLREFLEKTDFVRHPEKFLLGLNTSNVESSHRNQNMYRDKSNHLSIKMYNFMIDLSTLHAQELIEGKFENGERIYELEMSKGPVGNPKKERPKRHFIKDLMKRYFSEIVKPSAGQTDGLVNDATDEGDKDKRDENNEDARYENIEDENENERDENNEDESDTGESEGSCSGESSQDESDTESSIIDVDDLYDLQKHDGGKIEVMVPVPNKDRIMATSSWTD